MKLCCSLCGQELPEDEPCGCGKRVIEMVSIPKKKLREWRRGLMTFGDLLATHAEEIRAEIEGYLK